MMVATEPGPPPPPLTQALQDALTALLGKRFSTALAVREQHGQSESHVRAQTPDAVAFPQSAQEVQAVVRACIAHRTPLIPYGAGSSVEGATSAVRGGVTLNLSGMDRILAVNAEDFDCVVQPGVRRQQLNEHLRDLGLFFPIDPGADATVGGMASTRASGTNAVRYGTMREAVLGLQVVTADGRLVRTSRRARKSAAGYDLTRLFVGSEGTLGVITEVALRLHPIPEAISSAVCSFDTLEGAVETVVQTIQLGVPVARVEILDDVQMRAVNLWSRLDYPEKTTLFFEFHGSPRYVEEQSETVAALAQANGGGAFEWSLHPEDRSRLWKARHEAYYAAIGLRPGSVGWPTDVCVPISRLAQCIAETKADLAGASFPATILGHVGDGNFHVVFVVDPNSRAEAAEAAALNHRLVERALSMDGTCTGEHGIGLGKMQWLREELGEAVDLMRTLKVALDPHNLMNPGKIFDL